MDERNPIEAGEDLINLTDVTARIAYLEERDCKGQAVKDGLDFCNPDAECASCYEEPCAELEALRKLQSDLEQHGERSTAIRDGYLVTYAQDQADGNYGVGADSDLSHYMDWDGYAASLTCGETEFLGTAYFLLS